MQSLRQLVLLSVPYGCSLIGSGTFTFSSFSWNSKPEYSDFFLIRLSLTSSWVNLSIDRCRIKVAYDMMCNT